MRIPLRGTPDDWFRWLRGSDEKLRKDASLILGGLVPEDPVPPESLVERLDDSSSDIRFWAAIGLTGLEGSAIVAVPALTRVAASDSAFGNRQAALRAISQIAPSSSVGKQAILFALGDDSEWVRAEALRALISIRPIDEQDIAAIRRLENDPEPAVRSQVEITLRNLRLDGVPAA